MSGPLVVDAAVLAQRMRMARVLASRQKAMAAMPERYCNSTMAADSYSAPTFNVARPDADAFLTIKSRGV